MQIAILKRCRARCPRGTKHALSEHPKAAIDEAAFAAKGRLADAARAPTPRRPQSSHDRSLAPQGTEDACFRFCCHGASDPRHRHPCGHRHRRALPLGMLRHLALDAAPRRRPLTNSPWTSGTKCPQRGSPRPAVPWQAQQRGNHEKLISMLALTIAIAPRGRLLPATRQAPKPRPTARRPAACGMPTPIPVREISR